MDRINKKNIVRGINYLKRNGIKSVCYKVSERLKRDEEEVDYTKTVLARRPSEDELTRQRGVKFDTPYKISILIPAYETEEKLLIETIDSVAVQTYGNWELCILDASKDDHRRLIVKDYVQNNSIKYSDDYGSLADKIKYHFLNDNKGISGNTNEALNMSTGDYIALLDHDDTLEPDTLYEYMKAVDSMQKIKTEGQDGIRKIMAVYCDEDKITYDSKSYFDCHIKPDFDPILLCTNNYICHFLMVDRSVALGVKGFHSEYDGAQDHDFILRVSEGIYSETILHVPKVLYHWRSTPSSTAENPAAKMYAYDSGKRAVIDHFKRTGIKADVKDTEHLGFFVYDIQSDLEEKDVKVLETSEYLGLTPEKIRGISEDFILIVSKDLRPVSCNYLKTMLSLMEIDCVGAVTGRIIGKNGRLESAGYDKIEDGLIKERFLGLNRHYSGYMHKAMIQQKVDDFTMDLVLVRKEAVESYMPRIQIRDDYVVFFEPRVEFKRK